ncbi:MAG: hypothetical protein OXG46_10400 [Chloroflexi bacterium]|nr:hypothetical protein [Chloroflexota bacterium]
MTDQELAELFQSWAVEFIRKKGRAPRGIDVLRHQSDYMMAKVNDDDICD